MPNEGLEAGGWGSTPPSDLPQHPEHGAGDGGGRWRDDLDGTADDELKINNKDLELGDYELTRRKTAAWQETPAVGWR